MWQSRVENKLYSAMVKNELILLFEAKGLSPTSGSIIHVRKSSCALCLTLGGA